MSDLKDKPVSDRIPAPAKRWRNRFLAIEDQYVADWRHIKKGKYFQGSFIFPTKELAEQHAIDHNKTHLAVYLGAFPE